MWTWSIIRNLYLNVFDVYLPIQAQSWCPFSLDFSPVFATQDLCQCHSLHFSFIEFEPFSPLVVNHHHKLPSALFLIVPMRLLLMGGISMMIIFPPVENDPNYPVLASLFGTLQLIKVILVKNIISEQLFIKVHVFELILWILLVYLDSRVFSFQIFNEVLVLLLLT